MDKQKRAVYAWWLYDWANSAFILTVVAAFFPIFFKSYWCSGVDATVSTARLGAGNAIAGLIVAILAPLLGVIADAGGLKKRLLGMFLLVGACCTMSLYMVPQGAWLIALLFFLVASIGFNSGNIFYDALLIDVAEKEQMDWVSSVGYGIGYLGCGILFAVNMLMVNKPSLFGIADAAAAVKVSFVVSALWWLVFSLPLLLFVQEKRYHAPTTVGTAIKNSFSQVRTVARAIVKERPILYFLIAYWLYIDGVHTFVFMATDFGLSIGITAPSLMVTLLVVQFVGFPSAILFGALAKRVGAFPMIFVGISVYLAVCGIGTIFLNGARGFLLLGALTGVAQGGIQALSRSVFGKMVPADQSAEYFGFFNIVNRFAVIIGPVIVGAVGLLVRSAGVPSKIASRVGMSSLSILFIAGAIMLVIARRDIARRDCAPRTDARRASTMMTH